MLVLNFRICFVHVHTHGREFFFQVQSQVFSEANCASLISTLITNLINQYQNLQSDFTNRVEISKASASLNGVRTVPKSSKLNLFSSQLAFV